MKLPGLSHQLALEAPTRQSDGAGGFTEGWQQLGVIWAEVRARTGRTATAGPAAISRVGYKIVVRAAPFGHPERPAAEQRFRDGVRLFRIAAVAEYDPAGHYLVCYADEEVTP